MVKYYTDGSSALAPDPEDRRAGFSVIKGGKSEDQSTDELRNAESNALSSDEPSFYSGSGRKDKQNSKSPNSRFLPIKKKITGILLSAIIMISVAFFLATSNSFLSPSLNNVVTTVTDVQYSSALMRTLRLTQYQLKNTASDDSFAGKLKFNKMSSTFKKRLIKNGISVNGTGSDLTLSYKGKTITADEFRHVYENDIEFQGAFTKAKHGRIMGFFDNLANKFYKKNNLTRNTWKNYVQTNDAEANNAKFNETMTKEMSDKSDVSLRTNYGEEEERTVTTTDPETGEEVPVKVTDPETGEEVIKTETVLEKHQNDSGSATSNSTIQAKSYLESISQKVQKTVNLSCTAMNVANIISISIAAATIQQTINYFMNLAENPSKVLAGYGSESANNSFLNFMVTSETVEIEDYNSLSYNGAIDSDSDVIKLKTTSVTGSPMESQGMIKIMTGLPITLSAVSNYSIERISAKLSTNVNSFRACNIARSSTSLVSIAVSLIPGVGQVKVVGSLLSKLAIGAISTVSVSLLLSFLIPTIQNILFDNPWEGKLAKGIPGGEGYAMGAAAANGALARTASAFAPGSEDTLRGYNKINNAVIAQEAELDRYNRSPFDISSRNTFLGSIVYNFATTTSTGFMGKIKNLMRNTSSSISSIIGQVHADSNTTYMTTYGDCPILESINAKGDMYCNLIPVSDPSTLNISPDDENYVNAIESQLETENGKVKIKSTGELAKYINFCVNRESPYGVVDSNILTKLKSLNNEIGDFAVSLLGSVPGVGDAIDLVESGFDEANLPWATGEKCVADNSNPDWATFKYYQRFIEDERILEQMDNYDGEKSLVSQYMEQYEAENPLDNSPAGYLARISGISKDDAQLVIDIAWYYRFIDDYDANTRIAMNGDASDIPSSTEVIAKLSHNSRYHNLVQDFNSYSEPHNNDIGVIASHAIYADIRNRSYAV